MKPTIQIIGYMLLLIIVAIPSGLFIALGFLAQAFYRAFIRGMKLFDAVVP
jgi:hypothetical protein